MSFMFNPHPYCDPIPVNHPQLSARTVDSIISGEAKIAPFLAGQIADKLNKSKGGVVMAIDGYVSADMSAFVNLLLQQLKLRKISAEECAISACYKTSAALDEMLRENLSEDLAIDPVLLFGKLFKGGFETLFEESRLRALIEKLQNAKASATRKVTIIHGAGACHEPLLKLADLTVYLDVTPKQAVLRIKNGHYRNFGDESPRPFKAMMRRCYFYDFELACHLRARLLKEDLIDYYVANDVPGANLLLTREAFGELCAALAKMPFRCRPVYLEGVWGGQYIKKLRHLPDTMKNCAWVFDLIPLEVSLVAEAGKHLVEMPFFTFVCKQGEALMGKECVQAFGGYFPIRFNYDDTYHSNGNMSIQVHPGAVYSRENFNELGRQDESYYVVATGHGAKTYMGLCEDANADEFIADIKKSEREAVPVDYQRYINAVESKPGVQFMIPAGTVHASGRNQVILEIGSLTVGSYTFKMYDYLRQDLDGVPRPIHSHHGAKVLERGRTASWVKENIVQSPRRVRGGEDWAEYIVGEHDLLYFTLRRYEFAKKIEGDTAGVFHVLTLVDGEKVAVYPKGKPELRYELNYLDIAVVPANVGQYVMENLGNQPVCIHKTCLKENFKDSI